MAANEAAAVIDVQSEDIPATQPTQQPASLQAPRMIQAKQKRTANPLGLWIARTAAKARAKLQAKPAAVIYQQTAPAAPELIETPKPATQPTQQPQPEPLQVIEPTNPTKPETGQPAKGE